MDKAVIATRFFRIHVVGGVEILDFSTNLAGKLFSIERLNFADAILAIDPGDSYTRALRAMIYYREAQFDKALEDIENLISGNPDGPEFAPLVEIRNRLIEKN